MSVQRTNYVYENYPSEPWPIAVYTFRLDRSSFFYTWVAIIPGIVVTILSFAGYCPGPPTKDWPFSSTALLLSLVLGELRGGQSSGRIPPPLIRWVMASP